STAPKRTDTGKRASSARTRSAIASSVSRAPTAATSITARCGACARAVACSAATTAIASSALFTRGSRQMCEPLPRALSIDAARIRREQALPGAPLVAFAPELLEGAALPEQRLLGQRPARQLRAVALELRQRLARLPELQ